MRESAKHNVEDSIMNIFERQKDFLSVIEKLDISPTLFKNAKSKYEALAAFLDEHSSCKEGR